MVAGVILLPESSKIDISVHIVTERTPNEKNRNRIYDNSSIAGDVLLNGVWRC